MSDFVPLSTDQRSGDTSSFKSNIVLKGSYKIHAGTSINWASIAGGYKCTNTINLPIDPAVAILKCEGFMTGYNLGAGVVNNYPIPYVEISAAGAVARSAETFFAVGSKPASYALSIVLFDATLTPDPITVYYRVLSVGQQ